MANKRRQTIEAYAPVLGIKTDMPPELLDVRAQPTGQNFKCYYGINQKEYGTTLFATGVAAVVSGVPTMIFAATFPGAVSVLQVMTPSNVFIYTGGADSFVNDGQSFSGTYNDYWTATLFADRLFYTNGVDPIQMKSSYSATGTNLPSAVSPTTFNAWCLQGLNGFLNLYHTFENGTEYYKRVRWSAQAPLTYAAGTADFSSGVAGAQDIDDGEGALQTALPLAGGMALYFENSIHFQNFVGGDAVFNFQKMIPGIGIPGRRCAFGYQEVNYLLTYHNIYRYFGGYYLDPIGDPINKAIFGELNQQYINTSFIDFDKRDGELLINIPTGTATSPNVCWVYRVADKTWARKLREHSSAGVFQLQSGLTIGELLGNIGVQNFRFGEAANQVSAAIKLFGDPSGRIVQHDIAAFSLSQTGTATAQAYIYESPDLTGNKAVDPQDGSVGEFVMTTQRWQRISLEMHGNGSAHVWTSTDRGQSFQELDQSPVALITTGTQHFLDIDCNSPFIRVRVTNSGLDEFVGVRYLKLDFVPGQPV